MLILWVLLGWVLLVLLLAAVPVEMAFTMEHHDGHGKARGTVHWLFGWVRIPLGGRRRKASTKPVQGAARHRKGPRRSGHRLMAALEAEGFARRVLTLIHDLLRRIRIHELTLEGSVGLDDPADTGRLWGVLGPLVAVSALLPVVHIALEPRFTAEGIDVHAHSRLRFIPLAVLFVMMRFLLSPSTVRAFRVPRAAG